MIVGGRADPAAKLARGNSKITEINTYSRGYIIYVYVGIFVGVEVRDCAVAMLLRWTPKTASIFWQVKY